jgi:hypothetical protein
MSYDALISRLTEDLKPVRRRRAGIDTLIIALVCAVELTAFFALGAARPDIPAMMHQSTFWWRLASLGLIAGISCGVAFMSFNPAYSPKRGIRWLAFIVCVCLTLGLYIGAGPDSAAALIRRLDWTNGLQCTAKIVLLSIPPAIGLGALMRRAAPTDRTGTALLVGLAAAAWGGFIFVFACPFDDPLYIVFWYSVGCGTTTLLSRLILPRLTNW